MRLSDVFRGLGKPVAYYPSLVKPLGSPEAVVLFCQLLWWQDKTEHSLGVYKSVDELELETGLTYKMQLNAIKKLVNLKLIIKTHVRSEHKLYFKVDFDVFDGILSSLSPQNKQLTKGNVPVDQKEGATLPKGKCQLTKGNSVYKEQEITTENTTENKEKYKKEKLESTPQKPKTEKYRLPDDWVLSEKNRQYAKDHGFDDSFISLLAEGFADYWHSDDAKNPLKSDWDSAWRNHVRDRKMRGYGKSAKSSNDADFDFMSEMMRGCVNG